MAVGASTYGSVAGVEKLVGDVVASRAFGAGTVPTTTQVEGILDDVAAELNNALEIGGYTTPVAAADANGRAYLAAANNYGAAAIALTLVPTHVFNPDMEDVGQSRAEMYQARFTRALKVIDDQKIAASRAHGRLRHIYSGAQEDDDGNKRLPVFTRDEGVNTGTRSRVNTE